MGMLTRGEVAKRCGIRRETVRFYEARGLVEYSEKTRAGYRQFTEDVVGRIAFIKRAQALGFTLDEIATLLALRDRPDAACNAFRQRAQEKLDAVRERIRDLQTIEQHLAAMIGRCADGESPARESCSILHAMETTKEETEHDHTKS